MQKMLANWEKTNSEGIPMDIMTDTNSKKRVPQNLRSSNQEQNRYSLRIKNTRLFDDATKSKMLKVLMLLIPLMLFLTLFYSGLQHHESGISTSLSYWTAENFHSFMLFVMLSVACALFSIKKILEDLFT